MILLVDIRPAKDSNRRQHSHPQHPGSIHRHTSN